MEGKPTYCSDCPIGVHRSISFKVCFSHLTHQCILLPSPGVGRGLYLLPLSSPENPGSVGLTPREGCVPPLGAQ